MGFSFQVCPVDRADTQPEAAMLPVTADHAPWQLAPKAGRTPNHGLASSDGACKPRPRIPSKDCVDTAVAEPSP